MKLDDGDLANRVTVLAGEACGGDGEGSTHRRAACCCRGARSLYPCVNGPRQLVLLLLCGLAILSFEKRTGALLFSTKTAISRLSRRAVCTANADGSVTAPDVPRVSYTFPEAPRWPGDDAFFAELPCPRSSYRVVMPPGLPALMARSPQADACLGAGAATIVSAFFDIGRGGWGGIFKRNTSEYFRDSRGVFMTLRNPMVFFTTPDLVQAVLDERGAHGLADRTIVIGLAHQCMPGAGLYNRTAALMCDPTYRDGMLVTHHPEQLFPWYNIIMWAKVRFAAAASLLPHVGAVPGRYFYWMDAGCHPPVCRAESHAGACLRPWSGTNASRLRFAATEPLSARLRGMTDAEWSQQKRVVLAGTVFGGNAGAMTRGRDLFGAKVESLMSASRIADQDQLVWSLLLREAPGALEPFYTAYEWLPVLDWMMDPPSGDAEAMSPLREAESRWKLP